MAYTSVDPSVSAPVSAAAHPIRRYGVRVGAALGVIEIAHGLLSATALPGAVTAVFFGVAMLGLAYAGAAAARATHHVRTGAAAGLLAGVVLSAAYVIGYLLSAWLNGEALRRQYAAALAQAHLPAQSLNALTVAGIALTIALTFVGGGCGGAVAGAVGGLIGARRR